MYYKLSKKPDTCPTNYIVTESLPQDRSILGQHCFCFLLINVKRSRKAIKIENV